MVVGLLIVVVIGVVAVVGKTKFAAPGAEQSDDSIYAGKVEAPADSTL